MDALDINIEELLELYLEENNDVLSESDEVLDFGDVSDLEGFLLDGHSAESTKGDLYPVPPSGFEENEFVESNSGSNLDVVLQHGPTISDDFEDIQDLFLDYDYTDMVAIGQLDFELHEAQRETGPVDVLAQDDFGVEQRVTAGKFDEAIAANKEYCAELKKFLEELYHRKLVVENKIRILKEDVKANHTQKKKAVPNLSFSQFGHPYFKEKDGTPLPVYDDWNVLNKILKFTPFFHNEPKPKKMSSMQEAKLKEAVVKELVRIASEQLVISKLNAEKILEEKAAAALPHRSLSKAIEDLEVQIKEVNLSPQKWFRDENVYQFHLINWEKIRSEFSNRKIGYDADYLKQYWKVQLDPSFARGQLTAKEIECFKKLTNDHPEGFMDFQAIANQLATELSVRKRHVFQLFQFHQTRLTKKHRKFGWPKEEVERLKGMYNEVSPNKKRKEIWSEIRPHFPGRKVSAMENKLRRLSEKPESNPAAIKAVATNALQQFATPGQKGAVICEICDIKMKDFEEMRHHMLLIHEVKITDPPLKCHNCQCRFFTDQGLERHLLGSHGSVTLSMLEAAKREQDGGRCPICGKEEQRLLSHVVKDHGLNLKRVHLSYKCTVCKATFAMHKLLEKHVCTAHSARKLLDEDRAGPNEGTSSSTTTRTTHQDFCDLNVCRPSKSEKRSRVDWTGDNKKKEKPKCPPPKATTSKRSRTDDSK